MKSTIIQLVIGTLLQLASTTSDDNAGVKKYLSLRVYLFNPLNLVLRIKHAQDKGLLQFGLYSKIFIIEKYPTFDLENNRLYLYNDEFPFICTYIRLPSVLKEYTQKILKPWSEIFVETGGELSGRSYSFSVPKGFPSFTQMSFNFCRENDKLISISNFLYSFDVEEYEYRNDGDIAFPFSRNCPKLTLDEIPRLSSDMYPTIIPFSSKPSGGPKCNIKAYLQLDTDKFLGFEQIIQETTF